MAEQAGDRQTPGGNGAGPAPAVFRGVTQLVLDAKGRLAVPAKHRDGLAPAGDGKVVLTADPGLDRVRDTIDDNHVTSSGEVRLAAVVADALAAIGYGPRWPRPPSRR